MAMADGNGPGGWDFLTLVAWWNLYALPAVLLATAAFVVVRKGRLDRQNVGDVFLDSHRLVRIAALIHLGIGLHAALRLVEELLTMRVMGVSESFVNLIAQTVSVVINPLVARGLWRARPAGRRLAIGWYLLLSGIAVYVVVWWWRFHVAVEPGSWPEHFTGKLMPLFLLVVLFLPRVKSVFTRSKTEPAADFELTASGARPAPSGRWSIISLIALLFLIGVISNLGVDIAEWIERTMTSEPTIPDQS
jgi:hypothetical protein